MSRIKRSVAKDRESECTMESSTDSSARIKICDFNVSIGKLATGVVYTVYHYHDHDTSVLIQYKQTNNKLQTSISII
jgi:hypothetical protein